MHRAFFHDFRKNCVSGILGTRSGMVPTDGACCFFHLFQMLKQHELDIVCHGAVLFGGQNADFIKNLVGKTQRKNPFIGCPQDALRSVIILIVGQFSYFLYSLLTAR